MDFPIVALESAQAADDLDGALRLIGFAAVVGHGVGDDVIEAAWSAGERFFALPLAAKLAVHVPGRPYGYSPFRSEALARSRGTESAPDLKESYDLGPTHLGPEELAALGLGAPVAVWPDRPPGFRAALTAYYRTMEGLGSRLLGLAAAALELPAGQFTPFFVRHASALRALRYPPLERPPAPGRLRAGEHSDYGSFTILLPGPEPGLEVLTRAGDWLAVPPVPGAFVVNVGDLMQRWTNDRWVSTVHRVRAPEGEWAGRSRRSIAFFQNPHPDAVVTVLPGCVPAGEEPSYEPVVFADWLRAKVAAATG